MSDFVVGYDFPLFLAQDAVFLFFTYKYDLDSFEEVFLADGFATVFDSEDGSFVDHIGKIRAYGTAGGQSNRFEVYRLIKHDIFGMYL